MDASRDRRKSTIFSAGAFFAGVAGNTAVGLLSDRILKRTGSPRHARGWVISGGFVFVRLLLAIRDVSQAAARPDSRSLRWSSSWRRSGPCPWTPAGKAAGPSAKAARVRVFQMTPPAVHQMVVILERAESISRWSGLARSIADLVNYADLPTLEPGDREPIETTAPRYRTPNTRRW